MTYNCIMRLNVKVRAETLDETSIIARRVARMAGSGLAVDCMCVRSRAPSRVRQVNLRFENPSLNARGPKF